MWPRTGPELRNTWVQAQIGVETLLQLWIPGSSIKPLSHVCCLLDDFNTILISLVTNQL